MKLVTVFLIAITLSSCSDEDPTLYNVNASLTPYVDAFYSEASARGSNLKKSNLIVSLESELQAITVIERKGDQWYLKFDKEIFEEMVSQGNPNNKIESFLFHEMGKIVLKRELVKESTPQPLTIMNPYYKVNGFKTSDRAALLDELFK